MMECESCAEEAEVPEALASVTRASTVFYTLPSPLNDKGVCRHTLLATQDSQLVEVEEGTHILRSARLPPGDVTKVVIHHEFDPQQLFVVVLFSAKKIVILTYSNFKVVYERSKVADISSEDQEATGTPKLILTNTSGKEERLTGRRLLSLCDGRGEEGDEEEEEHQGKREAVAALATRLQGGLRQVKVLEGQRRSKERYIQRSLSALQAHLAGHQHNTPTTTLMPALTLPDTRSKVKPSEPSQLIQPPPKPQQSPPLSIINVRHKVVHDKWVIGINVINKGNRVVVHNPQLVLCSSGGCLSYSCRLLKMVRRTPAAQSHHPSAAASMTNSMVTIESLHPPVLRPGKRACVLATCELPGFLTGPTVTCSGLLTYTTRSLHAQDTQAIVPLRVGVEEEEEESRPGDVVQVSVGQVEIGVAQLAEHQVTFDLNPVTAGVSFSSVALVGSSVTTHVSLATITSPLTDIIAILDNTLTLVKVNDLRDFYCFYPNHHHPLRHAAFTITHPDPHTAALTLYTRDKNQALLAIHSLLAALPCDTTIQPPSDNTPVHTEVHKLRPQLLSKMSKVAMDIIDSYETRLHDREKVRKHDDESRTVEAGKSGGLRDRRLARQEEARRRSTQFEREVEDLKARERQVNISGQEYRAWRNTLRDRQMEMDELYIQFVKLISSLSN